MRTRFRQLDAEGEPLEEGVPRGPKPRWLKVPLPGGDGYMRMRGLLSRERLNTICVSGRCPNATDCFSRGTATFLLMGNRCTRQCGFCDVGPGDPEPLDPEEPFRVALAIARLGLSYAVITSVTRDDLPDGGAGHFAATVRGVKSHDPAIKVEVLVPDFLGRAEPVRTTLEAGPDVFGHNVECSRRLYPIVRPQGDYDRALEILTRARQSAGTHLIKSGFMVGLGETDDEIAQILQDLATAGCQIVTIGQYLRPSSDHLPVQRYVTPERFEQIEAQARGLGFQLVVAGPLVRSSYLADKAFEKASSGPFRS